MLVNTWDAAASFENFARSEAAIERPAVAAGLVRIAALRRAVVSVAGRDEDDENERTGDLRDDP